MKRTQSPPHEARDQAERVALKLVGPIQGIHRLRDPAAAVPHEPRDLARRIGNADHLAQGVQAVRGGTPHRRDMSGDDALRVIPRAPGSAAHLEPVAPPVGVIAVPVDPSPRKRFRGNATPAVKGADDRLPQPVRHRDKPVHEIVAVA